MDQLFLVLQNARKQLLQIEINRIIDLDAIRREDHVQQIGKQINAIQKDIDSLISTHKGIYYRS